MIFYFTGTGNSQMVAEIIAEHNGDRAVNITDAMKRGEYDYTLGFDDAVGFVLPTYYYGIPIQIPSFIEKLNFSNQPRYVWTCLTCDGQTAGAGGMLAQHLRARGWAPNAHFSCPVVNNAVVLGNQMPVRHPEILLDRAQNRAASIAKYVKDRRSGNYDECAGMGADFLTMQNYGFYKNGRKTKHFRVNSNCVACGRCADQCPSMSIELRGGKPVWTAQQCYYCLRCINNCPTKAITFNNQDNTYTFMNDRVKGQG